jgi:hypothetical protein
VDPETLYLQLRNLIAEMPVLHSGGGAVTPEINRWLGRAAQLVAETGNASDSGTLDVASNHLHGALRDLNAQTIAAIVFRALAYAESRAPTTARGAYVAVGAGFDALQAVGKVLATAKNEVLIIDAYMDGKVLTDFASTTHEGIQIRLLTDSFYTKPTALQPSAQRWSQQFGPKRPLKVRMSAPRALHDRLIIVDGGTSVWSLSQSLKDFAGRSPASVLQMPGDIAQMKAAHYEGVWTASTDLP